MSTWRDTGSPCPILGEAHMDRCQPCRYFRGASLVKRDWRMNCNWPRNGSELYEPPGPMDDLPADEIKRRTAA